MGVETSSNATGYKFLVDKRTIAPSTTDTVIDNSGGVDYFFVTLVVNDNVGSGGGAVNVIKTKVRGDNTTADSTTATLSAGDETQVMNYWSSVQEDPTTSGDAIAFRDRLIAPGESLKIQNTSGVNQAVCTTYYMRFTIGV